MNKPISQIIEESIAKNNEQKFDRLNKIKDGNWDDEDSDSDCEYMISDHSDDEDDDTNYDQVFAKDKKQGIDTLFEDMKAFKVGTFATGKNFIQNMKEKEEKDAQNMFQSKLPNVKPLNFKPIMNSPKKTGTKNKRRLYINKKKIPRWAEDLKKVREQALVQMKNPNFNRELFGESTMEMVETDTIFAMKGTGSLERKDHSTAKWKRDPKNEEWEGTAMKKRPLDEDLEI